MGPELHLAGHPLRHAAPPPALDPRAARPRPPHLWQHQRPRRRRHRRHTHHDNGAHMVRKASLASQDLSPLLGTIP